MGRPFLLPLFKPDAETRFQQNQSAIWRIHRDIARDFAFPTVAISKELVLVIVEFFAGFGREFEIRTFHDGIHRACFLAETAIDALHHIDVVTHRAAGAVVAARTSLDGDGLRRADRFAKLAGDAAFFTVRITAQRVLSNVALGAKNWRMERKNAPTNSLSRSDLAA